MTVSNASYQVAIFLPQAAGNPFWGPLRRFMQAAGNDLGIKIKAYYAEGNRAKMAAQIQEAVSGPNKVDAVVFQNFKQGGQGFLKIADKAQVPAFVLNAGMDYQKTGSPREKYEYWIGEMVPDDEKAGYDLANVLIDNANAQQIPLGVSGKYHIIGITGNLSDGASIEREKGLRRAVQSRFDANLLQVIPANWNFGKAKQRFRLITSDCPSVSIVWAANVTMALGVWEETQAMQIPVVIGGMDWSVDGVQAVKDGKLTVTIGGHFMEGGWAVVLLHDYFQGRDFEGSGVSMKSDMSILTQQNVNAYMKLFDKWGWQAIDFKQFSKVHNKTLTDYDFSLDSLLKQF